MPPHLFAALDYTLEDLGILFDGVKRREEASYDLALWHAYHVGVFCRAAYHAKSYPTWESVSRRWQAGKSPHKQPDWREMRDWLAAKATRPAKKKGKPTT